MVYIGLNNVFEAKVGIKLRYATILVAILSTSFCDRLAYVKLQMSYGFKIK